MYCRLYYSKFIHVSTHGFCAFDSTDRRLGLSSLHSAVKKVFCFSLQLVLNKNYVCFMYVCIVFVHVVIFLQTDPDPVVEEEKQKSSKKKE